MLESEKVEAFRRWATLLYLLNAYDMIMTLNFVVEEGGKEINPFMNYLLSFGPTIFIMFKISFFFAFFYFIIEVRKEVEKPLLWAVKGLTVLYFLIAVYHTFGFYLAVV